MVGRACIGKAASPAGDPHRAGARELDRVGHARCVWSKKRADRLLALAAGRADRVLDPRVVGEVGRGRRPGRRR